MKKTIAVIFLLLAANVFAQDKFALVIGNGNYTSFGSLQNALNDANDMAAALQSLGFNVDKVLDGNRAQMVAAVSRLKSRLSVSNNSYGFLFYAGHGVQFNGVNYLIPATADIPNANYLGDTSISVQTVLAELNDAGNELNVIVLDACRDFPAVWSRSLNRGLTVVTNQPADSIIVYATSAGSIASDGIGRNGLFTSQLLKNLTTPGLEISEIFRRTGANVSQVSNRQQIPAVYNQFFGIAYLGKPNVQASALVSVQPEPEVPIRDENGVQETSFDSDTAIAIVIPERNEINRQKTTAIDPNKFIFGFNINPGGYFLTIGGYNGGGFGFNFEFGKGNFFSEINILLGDAGGGFLFAFNYFWHSRIGGAYLGGGIGWQADGFSKYRGYSSRSFFPIGLNTGYKFVTRYGIYFRIGTFVGYDLSPGNNWDFSMFFKPDLAIGLTMR